MIIKRRVVYVEMTKTQLWGSSKRIKRSVDQGNRLVSKDFVTYLPSSCGMCTMDRCIRTFDSHGRLRGSCGKAILSIDPETIMYMD